MNACKPLVAAVAKNMFSDGCRALPCVGARERCHGLQVQVLQVVLKEVVLQKRRHVLGGCTGGQGLPLVQFSAQLECFLRDRGLRVGVVLSVLRGATGVFRVCRVFVCVRHSSS